MNGISNQRNCAGGVNAHFVFHYHINFHLKGEGYFKFHTPLDAGHGGMITMDGIVMSQTQSDVW